MNLKDRYESLPIGKKLGLIGFVIFLSILFVGPDSHIPYMGLGIVIVGFLIDYNVIE